MEEIELIDIADDLLIINKTTIERLFQEPNQNTLALYMFYYKTAKWQKINPIKANDDYCKRCLHWGNDKLTQTKKRLKELNLIETIKRVDKKGTIVGWFIRINYLIQEPTTPISTTPISPVLGSQETNTNNNNNINTNNNNNIYKQKNFKKPTLEEVEEYCKERNNNINAQKFIDFYESKGWKVGKTPMKDWKACIRTWEGNNTNKPTNVVNELPERLSKDTETNEMTKEERDELDFLLGEITK